MTQQVLSSAGAIKESNSFGNAGYGTSLPASPTDGMEYVLVDSTTLPTYQWRFRYNNGSSNTHKWEFVGGAPLRPAISGGISTSSTAYVDLTSGPSVTVPRAGVYTVEVLCYYATTGGVNTGSLQVNGSTSGAVITSAPAVETNVSGLTVPLTVIDRMTLTAASETVKLQVKNTAATAGQFGTSLPSGVGASLSITPVRVS